MMNLLLVIFANSQTPAAEGLRASTAMFRQRHSRSARRKIDHLNYMHQHESEHQRCRGDMRRNPELEEAVQEYQRVDSPKRYGDLDGAIQLSLLSFAGHL